MTKQQGELIEKPKRGRKKKDSTGEIVAAETTKSLITPSGDTEEQLGFIEADIKSNIILKATAGSGKTASAVKRVRFLLNNGVDPKKIIFFSYTTAAVNEFKKRLNNEEVKITTIHAFCLGMLSRMKKFKEVVDIYQFIDWYKEKYKPRFNDSEEVKADFYDLINQMYDEAQYIGSSITAYKLQTADKIKCVVPKFYNEYRNFLKEKKARDFSDMLIEINNLLSDNRWLNLFKGQYDHILIDEGQDTSTIMMKILLRLNAPYYTLILDTNQSIYQYSGANAKAVIDMLKARRDCKEMNLSINFRSTPEIVEYTNKYSTLTAKAFKPEGGTVHKNIILLEDLIHILKDEPHITILVRTNSVIREIEKKLMMRKVIMRYNNYLTPKECDMLKKAEARPSTLKKVKALLPVFKTADNAIQFIEECNSNPNVKSEILTIHKSKGLEYPSVVLVNSLAPELLEENNIKNLPEKTFKEISFYNDDTDDPENFEAKNVFFVGCSRAIHTLRFMIYGV